MKRCVAFALAVVSCTPSPKSDTAEGPVLVAADTAIYPSDQRDAVLASDVDFRFDVLDAAVSNGAIMLVRFTRLTTGLAPVPDTSATPTEIGILVDSASRVLGAVTGDAPYYTTYLFDERGNTIGVETIFDDLESGCAEILGVRLRWVLRGDTVVQYARRLQDQDERGVSTEACGAGVGYQVTHHQTWTDLARSLGVTPAPLTTRAVAWSEAHTTRWIPGCPFTPRIYTAPWGSVLTDTTIVLAAPLHADSIAALLDLDRDGDEFWYDQRGLGEDPYAAAESLEVGPWRILFGEYQTQLVPEDADAPASPELWRRSWFLGYAPATPACAVVVMWRGPQGGAASALTADSLRAFFARQHLGS